MSDGALSQAEIDALLSGSSSAPAAGGGGNVDTVTLGQFLAGNTGALSSNFSMMTGGTVTFSGPQVTSTTREDFLGLLPDMVTVVKADFTSGFPGEHSFIMGEDTAKAIASVMNKEENIQLDEMAMSVIGEVASQITGSQITALTQKTGNKSIAAASPQAANVAKAAAALPAGSFVLAAYTLDLGGASHQFWEVYGENVVNDISDGIKGGGAPQSKPGGAPPGGMGMGMGGGFGGAGMGGGFSGGMIPPGTQVQPVQYPNLTAQLGTRETGNISLLMDVLMEMTVELGRTKKPIKEILAMGEGTIIELDKLAGEPVDILVNHKLIAKGEVVVIDENFGIRVTEILSQLERMADIS